ncbi:MAG: extracellular solute-binding protein [Oscillibacter sp.]|nr:extracellular solute-binding protein [Oscillibacter sp.]
MKKHSRLLAAGLSGLLTLSLLAGCGSDSKPAEQGSSGDGAEKTVLKVQLIGDFKGEDFTDPISGAGLKGCHVLEEEFERLHEDIDLQYIFMGWDDYQKKTQSMMIAGEADVYQAPGIDALAGQGLLEPLQPYIDKDNYDLSVYLDGQVDGWKVAGPEDSEPQIYGLPMIADTRFIIYDKQLFDEWGVEYLSAKPTVEEILEKAAKLTGTNPVSGEVNYGIFHKGTDAGDIVMNLSEYYGGTWGSGFRASEMTVNFDTDTMVQAMETLVKMNEYAPDGVMANQGGEMFGTAQNNLAMHLRCHPAILNNINAQGLGERYGVARLFINEAEGKGGMFAGSPVVIAASSKVKDAAWEYVKFVGSEFFAQYFWENQRNEGLPCIKSALDFDGVKDDANVAFMMDTIQYLWTPRYTYRSGQGRSILTTAVEEVTLNGKDPAEVLKAAQKEVDEWIAAQ